jgi:hypothetical protein
VAFCIEVLKEPQEVRLTRARAVKRGMREGDFIKVERAQANLSKGETQNAGFVQRTMGNFCHFCFIVLWSGH